MRKDQEKCFKEREREKEGERERVRNQLDILKREERNIKAYIKALEVFTMINEKKMSLNSCQRKMF